MNLEQFLTLAVPGSRWSRRLTVDGETAECTITAVRPLNDAVTLAFRSVWWNGTATVAQPHAVRCDWTVLRADMCRPGDAGTGVDLIERLTQTTGAAHEWIYLGPPAGPIDRGAAAPDAKVVARRVDELAPGDVIYGPWATWAGSVERVGPEQQVPYAGRRYGQVVLGGAADRRAEQPGYTVDHVDLSTALAVVYTREGWPLWLRHDAPVAVAVDERDELPPAELPTVFLTVNTVSWLWRTDTGLADLPMCISRNRLAGYGGRLKRAVVPELLIDSGGFTELKHHGRHRLTPEQFVTEVRTFLAHLAPGQRVKVAQQDWMCEDVVIYGGRTKDGTFVGTRPAIDPDGVMSFDELVHEHQRRSVANLIELRRIAPDLHIVPVLQGSTLMQYARHAGMLEQAGIRLADEPLVGLGSVCRRQGTRDIEQIVRYLARLGYRLHGFGVGVAGLEMYGDKIRSSDSNAFSFNGRRAVGLCPHGIVKHETNCPVKARDWWDNAQARLRRGMRTRTRCTRTRVPAPVRVPAPRRPVEQVPDVWAAVVA